MIRSFFGALFLAGATVIAFAQSPAPSTPPEQRGLEVVVKALAGEHARAGRQILVFIAIDRYQDWLPLRNPVKDAREIKGILQRRYWIDETFELYDAEATKAGILRLFERLITETRPEDSVFVYYAGHGHLDTMTDTGFWIPVDGGTDRYEQRNWIPNTQVRNMLGKMRARHVALASDSCFAGDILNPTRSALPEITSDYFRNAYARVSRQVLTSGASEAVPDDSPFSRQLKLALEGNNRPYLDPLQLYSEIRLGTPGTTPLFGNLKDSGHQEGGSFLFFLRPTAQTSDGSGAKERANTLALARDYIDTGAYDRALDILDRLLIADAGDEEAKRLRDQAVEFRHRGAGETKPEATVPEKAPTTALVPHKAEGERMMREINELVDQGRKAVESGQLDEGRAAFTEARDRFPAGEDRFAGQKLAEMADAFYASSKKNPGPTGDAALREAIQTARDAKKKDSGNAAPYYLLGKINADLSQTDNAILELKEATRLDPKNYLYAFELGKAYYRARRFEEARQSFEACVTLNPKFESAFYNLGLTHQSLKDPVLALAAFKKVVQLKPDYSAAWLAIGRIYMARKDKAQAIDAFKKAVQADPANPFALRELAVAYADSGDYAQTETNFQKALALSDDAVTNYNMATVKLNLGKGPEAIPYAEKAVKLSPSAASYQYTLGLAFEAAGKPSQALAAYTEATRLDRTSVEARINLGRLFLDQGDFDRALIVLEEAYALAPNSLEVNNNLGNAYGKKGLWEKSVIHYEKARALAPRNTTILFNLAGAFVSAGKKSEARDAYSELIKLSATEWDAYFELGKLLISMGNSADAKKILTELLSQNPHYEKSTEVRALLKKR